MKNKTPNNEETTEQATVAPMKKVSTIWLIPIIAVLMGLWMIYYELSTQGTLISIKFSNAEGMQIGKTKLKARNVNIGEVKSIKLNDDSEGVTITARVSKSAEYLLREDTEFWLVSPKISHAGISGLDTLISGVYIEMQPGISDNNISEFTALPEAPLTPPGTLGIHITLQSSDYFSYSKGDPIIYKGLTVGKFETIEFDFKKRTVYYNIFIKAPYHELVTSNTLFWDVSGLRMDLSADGISMQTGNIETILTNGVTFDVPQGMPFGERAEDYDFFDVYIDYDDAVDKRYSFSHQSVVLVSDTIRGLNVGAPVEYRGVQVGKVLNINLLANKSQGKIFQSDFEVPILIGIQPGRIGLPDNEEGIKLMEEQNKLWIKGGLKATLKTGNLLTGSLFVELQHYDEQPVTEIETYEGYPVIPVQGNEFTQLTAKAENFMNTLNSLPLNNMADNGNTLLLELGSSVKDLQHVIQSLSGILDSVEEDELSAQLANTLNNISTLSKDYSSGSKSNKELNEALSSLTTVMYELKPLLNELNKKPNSFIFNSGQSAEIEPKKHSGAKQ